MGIAVIVVVSLCFGFFLGFLKREGEVNKGEALVRCELSIFTASADYHLLNNVTLSSQDGTTQVDHILLSRYGVFVIETKHYKGWIFADRSRAYWTQLLYKFRYKFQNPLFQNRKHVIAVEGLLDFLSPECIHSVVVFTGDAVFKTPRPEGVFSLRGMSNYITGFTETVLTKNKMQFCVGRLECCRLPPTRYTDIEHVAYLRRRFGNVI